MTERRPPSPVDDDRALPRSQGLPDPTASRGRRETIGPVVRARPEAAWLVTGAALRDAIATSGDATTGWMMLDGLLDIQRMRQYFDVAVRLQQTVDAARRDVGFLAAARRGLFPLPTDPGPAAPEDVFPAPEPLDVPSLQGRRLGLVATGGSGALASLVGVARALEEAQLRCSVLSLCSGSALFGLPLAAGLSAEETARFAQQLDPSDYVRPAWHALLSLPISAGRGFSGVLDGQRVEAAYRRRLGDRRLGDLEIPAYVVVWNCEHNRLDYLGPATSPDLPVATAVRLAVTLPLMIEAAPLGDGYWCDGGIVDIFPIRPVLDIEPPCDTVIGINGFYRAGFAGDDITGWQHRPLSILHLAGQTRTMQHLHVARLNLERLREETDLLLLEPVPYREAAGVGLYRHFLDTSRWPTFMALGRTSARAALVEFGAVAA